jgi:cytochrome c553
MKYSRFLGAAAAVLVTTAVAQQAAEVTPVAEPVAAAPVALADNKPATFGDAKAGQAKAGACAACHGLDGNASDPQYPKLAGQHERYIWRHLKLFRSGERNNPIMLGMAAPLSEQDMRDIGAYFATQQALAGVADDSVIASGPNQGKKFYQVGEKLYRAGKPAAGVPACMACHGPTGRGNPGPSYPSVGGQHAAYTAAKLMAFRSGEQWGKDGNANAIMNTIARNLSDEEIQSLASYIQGLHAAAEAAPMAAGK